MSLRVVQPGEPGPEPETRPQVRELADFQALYRDHVAYVYASFRRLGIGEADLQDLAHELFLIVHRRLADLDPQRPVRPWLFGMARRVAANHRRSAPVRRELSQGALPGDAEAQGGATLPPDHEGRSLIARALGSLAPDRRAMVILHDLDGFTVPEISVALEIPVPTLYAQLRRARAQFADVVRALDDERATDPAPTQPPRPASKP